MQIPAEVQRVLDSLEHAGFGAYVVGGCVRDFLRHAKPKDWDVATSATPEQIQQVFPQSFYENRFGTVTIHTGSDDPTIREVEVTTYRTEAEYTDQRHPDHVAFTTQLEDDLARRDFTINAMGIRVTAGSYETVDPFGGVKDLEAKIIRAVGKPEERFAEDALRLMRAVRFAVTLGFTIEPATLAALKKHAADIRRVSQERIRDEFVQIIFNTNAEGGINLLNEAGLLQHILPELTEGIGVKQNKHHIYTVFDHNVKSLGFSARANDPLHVRLATLFHDVGKPRTKKGEYPDATFYAHDIVGASMTRKILTRFKFPNDMVKQVSHLVRHHLFMYDIGVVSEAGVRRLLRRVGPENFQDLLKVRMAERLGSGVPKARPYRLRHLEFMAEKVSRDPLSTKMLKINGNDLMKDLGLQPGPIIGAIMDVLLGEVLDDPTTNTRETLLKRAKALAKQDLAKLRAKAKDTKAEKEREDEEEIKRKYHVS
jgi:tRNA nucleotidyltransferase (CCA-adding enzyme)